MIQPLRGGSNNYEMLSMVVAVEAVVGDVQGKSEFAAQTITNPSKGKLTSVARVFSRLQRITNLSSKLG